MQGNGPGNLELTMKHTEKKEEQERISGRITRREFTGFFLLGSLISFLEKKTPVPAPAKKAMFWKKSDAS